MEPNVETRRAGLTGLAHHVITAWALAGGVVLLLVVLVNILSVAGSIAWKPFPGDFELTEVGVAVAAFAFLPYCQLTGANVTADIFTAGAGKRALAAFALLAGLTALGFSLLLMNRMYFGMLDQKAYGYTTAILQLPHWIVFIPILISLALLSLAALLSLLEAVRELRSS